MFKGFKYILSEASYEIAILFIGFSLMIGYFKGKYVMKRAVMRIMDRVTVLPQPVSFTQVYSPSYILLVGAMVTLGIGLKMVGLPIVYLGGIDLAIGSALLQGALHWARK